jgi:hypothetical protein
MKYKIKGYSTAVVRGYESNYYDNVSVIMEVDISNEFMAEGSTININGQEWEVIEKVGE